jgi:predicted dehydrogenase
MRWGIIGTGGIAEAMANTILHMDDAIVTAVASRSAERAHRFAAAHGIPNAFDDVAALAESDEVDCVYVGSANHRHLDDATQCLLDGKPVLCEKPLTTSLADAEQLVGTARSTGSFLMEAMWMRFQPFWDPMLDWIEQGRIGELRHITADFGIPADPDPGRRWFDPEQGGGALLDVGIYPVTLACLLAGEPLRSVQLSVAADTGVDAQTAAILEHPGGVISVLGSSFVADTPIEATVSGPSGRIHLAAPFHHTPRMSLWVRNELVEELDTSYAGSGYRWEVREVQRCVEQGLAESPRHPLEDTLMVMRVLHTVAGGR